MIGRYSDWPLYRNSARLRRVDIEMKQIQQIPTVEVGAYIAALAKQHGVSYAKTKNDALAEAITRLADDEVVTDETEDLVVALRRADVIDGPTMVLLLGRYLDEKRQVAEQAHQRAVSRP